MSSSRVPGLGSSVTAPRPTPIVALPKQVATVVGPDALLDPAGYAVDGRVPAVAVRPANRDQVADLLALASETGVKVVPWGGGTRMSSGLPPAGVDLVLVLDRLNRVVEHEPADLTVTVEAGITLAALQAALAEKGQNLGLDGPLADRATIGGILAANVSGSRRLAFGTARDLTLGLTVVQPSGIITKSGGKVVKNVAGFDLNKLYIGSFGTLAVIVEATFKVMPLPRPRATLIVPLNDVSALAPLAAELRRVNLPLRALDALVFTPDAPPVEPLSGDCRAAVLIDVAGTPAALDRQVRDLTDLLTSAGQSQTGAGAVIRLDDDDVQREFWQAVQDFGRDGSPADVMVRLGFPPSRFGAVLESVAAVVGGRMPAVTAQAGSGVLTLFWSATAATDSAVRIRHLRERMQAVAGVAVVERCPLELKEQVDVWGPAGPELRLIRAIKDQFDPARILSPGRYVGGI